MLPLPLVLPAFTEDPCGTWHLYNVSLPAQEGSLKVSKCSPTCLVIVEDQTLCSFPSHGDWQGRMRGLAQAHEQERVLRIRVRSSDLPFCRCLCPLPLWGRYISASLLGLRSHVGSCVIPGVGQLPPLQGTMGRRPLHSTVSGGETKPLGACRELASAFRHLPGVWRSLCTVFKQAPRFPFTKFSSSFQLLHFFHLRFCALTSLNLGYTCLLIKSRFDW